MECLREEEFAPIKNPNTENSDSPNTAKAMMQHLHRKWLESKNVKFSRIYFKKKIFRLIVNYYVY